MKGNRNNGMGLAHAASVISSLWKNLTRYYPAIEGGYFDYEFKRVIAQMRKRVKAKGGAE